MLRLHGMGTSKVEDRIKLLNFYKEGENNENEKFDDYFRYIVSGYVCQ
jgi:hypothetical protein